MDKTKLQSQNAVPANGNSNTSPYQRLGVNEPENPLSGVSAQLLDLPFDIHTVILDYLSPFDIFKLRSLSHASYSLYTSPSICSYYLSTYGITKDPQEPGESAARRTFDKYFTTRARIRNSHPTKAIVIDGIRQFRDESPYFGRHADNADSIIAYRNTDGDLVIIDLYNSEKSAVLSLDLNWSFRVQSLKDYNISRQNGVSTDRTRIQSHRSSLPLPSSVAFWAKKDSFIISLDKFNINIHHDCPGRLLIELAWASSMHEQVSNEVQAPTLPPDALSWGAITKKTRNLGVVLSLEDKDFGAPVAVFSLPPSLWPFSEYIINRHYVAGIVSFKGYLAFTRYAREDMATVYSIQGYSIPETTDAFTQDSDRAEVHPNHTSFNRDQTAWPLPAYLSKIALIQLSRLGISDYEDMVQHFMVTKLNLHLQEDVDGKLLFLITGAGVTAFDVRETYFEDVPLAVGRYCWRRKEDMEIYLPEPADGSESDEIYNPYRPKKEGRELRAKARWPEHSSFAEGTDHSHVEQKISPSLPKIWKSILPKTGNEYHYDANGNVSSINDMFTIIRAYNYLNPSETKVSSWQRPDFLVSWDIPLTIEGLNYWTPEMLNRRAGIKEEDKSSWDPSDKSDAYMENTNGIYPNKIMELHPADPENPSSVLRCFEVHPALISLMPRMTFGGRDVNKWLPRWLKITKMDGIIIDDDEFRTFAGPARRSSWAVKRRRGGALEVQRRGEYREQFRMNWNIKTKVQRPYQTKTTVDKRRIGFMGMFGRLNVKTSVLAVESTIENPPYGSVQHVRVSHSGSYLAYVVTPTSSNREPTKIGGEGPDYNRVKTVQLVIIRYN